jgi:hypothetical protein
MTDTYNGNQISPWYAQQINPQYNIFNTFTISDIPPAMATSPAQSDISGL